MHHDCNYEIYISSTKSTRICPTVVFLPQKYPLPATSSSHRFHMMILRKRHTGNDRHTIQYSELHTLQDFSERLALWFNNEIESKHFGGSCNVSLEGVAVRFFNANASCDSSPVMESSSHFYQIPRYKIVQLWTATWTSWFDIWKMKE